MPIDIQQMRALTDETLVGQAQAGVEMAFAELLARYRDAVYYTLLKMVNKEVDAEDLTIETFSKVFKHIHQYNSDYAFSTWLFRIATNHCIDFIRKKKTVSIYSLDQYDAEQEWSPFPCPSTDLDPEADLIAQQMMVHLRNVVSGLKSNYRKLIELRYFEDYSYEEIASTMNLPLGTVKAQLFRARELLYQVLKSHSDMD